MKFIIDIHLDLSMNAIEWNRDLTQSVLQINAQEKDLIDKPDRGKATVSLQAMRKGNIGFCVATQIARYIKSITHYQVGILLHKHGLKPKDNLHGTEQWKKQMKWYK